MRDSRDSLMGPERRELPPSRMRVVEKNGRLIVLDDGVANGRAGRSNSGSVGFERIQSGLGLFFDAAAFGKYLGRKLGAAAEDADGKLYYAPPLVNGKAPGGDPRPRYITPAQQVELGRHGRVLVLLMLAFIMVTLFDAPFGIPSLAWIVGILIVGFRTVRAIISLSKASMKNISETPLDDIHSDRHY